ncbi:hypothetical protein [Demequina mangrovi]|uniref:Dolichyl-phosphate-mannose-protein mannosyltransferase n=1 Tax=Demequina mangrovi TaxID=1043493 RepID=A0A1H6YR22_9MICO|nr:hypothetical protein [Demequina mangrovi]SEJ39770.1 hypothetical protein SAMN05421637_1707 [Demequina mangrovi]
MVDTAKRATGRVSVSGNRQRAANIVTLLVWLSFAAAALRNTMTASEAEWGLSEWAINYEGGFVRRGLTGQAALLLSRATGLSLLAIAVLASLATLGMLVALGVLAMRRGYIRGWVVPSAALLGGIVYFDNLVRKDALLLVLLAAALAALGSEMRVGLKIILANIAAAVAILTHEAFAAFALPALTLVAWTVVRGTGRGPVRTATAVLALAPAWATALVVATHSAPPRGVGAVWRAWFAGGASPGVDDASPDSVTGAVEALTWDAPKAVEVASEAFGSPKSAVWFGIAVVAILVTVAALPGVAKGVEVQGLWPWSRAMLVVVAVGGSGALWIAGEDYGRWIIFGCGTVALVWCWHLASVSPEAGHEFTAPLADRLPVWLPPAVVLVFSTAGYGTWNLDLYLSGTPLWQIPLLVTDVAHSIG